MQANIDRGTTWEESEVLALGKGESPFKRIAATISLSHQRIASNQSHMTRQSPSKNRSGAKVSNTSMAERKQFVFLLALRQ